MGSDDLFKKRQARNRKTKRNAPSRKRVDRVLIVCEGEKTEPKYFDELINCYKLNSADITITGECGSDPVSIVEEAKKLYRTEAKKGLKYNKVYCVFDKDHHANYLQALGQIKGASPKDVFLAITSIPCFEYWILLHFEYTTRPFVEEGGRSPCDCVNRQVRQVFQDEVGFPDRYNKGDSGLFGLLEDKLITAIKNSKKVIKQGELEGTQDPSTLMHELVAYLINLKSR